MVQQFQFIYLHGIHVCRLTKAGLVNQCAMLQGMLSTSKDEVARKIDQINFDYILPDGPAVVKKNGSSKTNNKEGKSKYDEYLEALRDFQNGQITKLGKILHATFSFKC